MVDANSALFSHLENYCLRRGEPLESAGRRRYVTTTPLEREYLKDLKVASCIRFGNHRSLTHLWKSEEHYIGLLGFDIEPELPQVTPVAVNGGMATCLLSEVKPLPLAGPAQIRNIVEVGSMDDSDYSGHDCTAIQSLFPRIQMLQCSQPLDKDSAWRLFLMLCAEECREGGSWVEAGLSDALVSLTDLNVPFMPYPAICRSMFDADPRSLFMALYRCIEATYAYESSRRLVERLALKTSWQDVAAALESELGWHPQEAMSLNLVLQYALEQDLREICSCLDVVDIGKDVQTAAGRAIYSLRNSVVHFRPGAREVEVEDIDWNKLCCLMIGVVFSVFTHAYS
ncbi:hypothetical protein ACH47V_05985 [Micromonospora chersina]|uniref:hypothetical protein n=1 Tax=Micromonospora chersina TaxID=47854 RepID=UPI0033DE9320